MSAATVTQYLRTMDALLANRVEGDHGDEIEARFVDELDELWFSMTKDEQEIVELHHMKLEHHRRTNREIKL